MHVLLQVIADKNDGISCLSSRVYQEEGDDEIDLWLKVIAEEIMAFLACLPESIKRKGTMK